MAFKDKLSTAIESSQYSRKEIAEMLGVTKAAISNYENGVSVPKSDVLMKMFGVLGVDANFLFGDEYEAAKNKKPALLMELVDKDEIKLVSNYRVMLASDRKLLLTLSDRFLPVSPDQILLDAAHKAMQERQDSQKERHGNGA